MIDKYDIDREVVRFTRPFAIAKIPSLLALDGALVGYFIIFWTKSNHIS